MNDDEKPTLLQATQHEPGFWQAAYSDHGGCVLAFLRHRLGAREEAEDLLQETFVRAIRASSFEAGGNLRGYLLRIARNLAINRLRRPRLVVAAQTGEDGLEPLDQMADPNAGSPERSAQWSAFRQRFEHVLQGLNPSHRRAFELGVLEQLSYQEVARRTGWSLALVKVNVHRARRKILDTLGDEISGLERRS